MNKQIIIPPVEGWLPQAYYWCEISVRPGNPIWNGILYTSFLSNGQPTGNILHGALDEPTSISRVRYLKAVHLLHTPKTIRHE